MKIGYYNLDDPITIAFFIFIMTCALADIVVILLMAIFLCKELCDYYIDLLRILRYACILIYFCMDLYSIVWMLFSSSIDTFVNRLISDIVFTLYFFYVLNQLSFFILIGRYRFNKTYIVHLKQNNKMKEGVKFDQCRSKSRTIETWTLAAVVFAHIALTAERVILTIIGGRDIEVQKETDT